MIGARLLSPRSRSRRVNRLSDSLGAPPPQLQHLDGGSLFSFPLSPMEIRSPTQSSPLPRTDAAEFSPSPFLASSSPPDSATIWSLSLTGFSGDPSGDDTSRLSGGSRASPEKRSGLSPTFGLKASRLNTLFGVSLFSSAMPPAIAAASVFSLSQSVKTLLSSS